MKRFLPPKTNYSDLRDVGKYNLLWNISLSLIPVFLILLCIHIIFDDKSWLTSLGGLLVGSINVFALYKTRKYYHVAIWTTIIAVLLCQAVIFLIDDSHIISDSMWAIIIAFFTFFIFGIAWGSFVMAVNLFGLVYKNIFLTGGQTFGFEQVYFKDYLGLIINVVFVGAVLCYIIYQLVRDTNKVIDLYKSQIDKNDVLVKEIHHRVKNNLQVISSLLKLQSDDIGNEDLKGEFDDAIGRIRSMALIHEKMYQKEDLSDINIREYFDALANEITRSQEVNTKVKVNIKSNLVSVESKSLVPLSLIFNELMTNSVKHGFKNKNEGEIEVSFYSNDGSVMLNYSDNGKWIEPINKDSFGLEIIKILTEQLEGKCVRNTENKTEFQFTFPSTSISFN